MPATKPAKGIRRFLAVISVLSQLARTRVPHEEMVNPHGYICASQYSMIHLEFAFHTADTITARPLRRFMNQPAHWSPTRVSYIWQTSTGTSAYHKRGPTIGNTVLSVIVGVIVSLGGIFFLLDKYK